MCRDHLRFLERVTFYRSNMRAYEENLSRDAQCVHRRTILHNWWIYTRVLQQMITSSSWRAHHIAYHLNWEQKWKKFVHLQRPGCFFQQERRTQRTMNTINTQLALRSLMSISIAALMLCPGTSILSIRLSPTCGHSIMQLENGYHEILREPKVYRYRTWQDTAVRHTLSSFELVRVEPSSRTACLSRKHSRNFHQRLVYRDHC